MTTFYICRHGETENNKNHILSGWLDTPLTIKGIENVHASAQKLKDVRFDSIQSSDLGRAVATAELIANDLGFKGDIVHSAALREVNYGDWGGTSYEKTIAKMLKLKIPLDKITDFAPPNGESMREMQNRALEFLNTLNKPTSEQAILLTAHDGTIKAIYANFAGIDLGEHDANYEYPHDFVAKFSIEDGEITDFIEVKAEELVASNMD